MFPEIHPYRNGVDILENGFRAELLDQPVINAPRDILTILTSIRDEDGLSAFSWRLAGHSRNLIDSIKISNDEKQCFSALINSLYPIVRLLAGSCGRCVGRSGRVWARGFGRFAAADKGVDSPVM